MMWLNHDKRYFPLIFSAFFAFIFEFSILFFLSWDNKKITQLTYAKSNDWVEAEILEIPTAKKENTPRKKRSVSPDTIQHAASMKTQRHPEDNKINSEQQLAIYPPTHGPIALYAPPPTIPVYLRDKSFKAHTVIDFFISSLGTTTVRLISSSKSEELDAIAVESVKKWKFKPAQKENLAIDSKVRLRILFQVE